MPVAILRDIMVNRTNEVLAFLELTFQWGNTHTHKKKLVNNRISESDRYYTGGREEIYTYLLRYLTMKGNRRGWIGGQGKVVY